MSLSIILAVYAAIMVAGAFINWFWADKIGFDKATNADYVAECMEHAFIIGKGFCFWKFFIATFTCSVNWYRDIWNNKSKAFTIFSIIFNLLGLPLTLLMVAFVGICTKIQARKIEDSVAEAFRDIAASKK